MLAAFGQQAAAITLKAPKIPLVSSVTGQLVGPEVTEPAYWQRQVRHSVRFATAMQTLASQGCDLFLEVGPHPVLLGMGRQCLPTGSGTWLPSLRRGQDAWTQILNSLGTLWCRGFDINWSAVETTQRVPVSLPTYPFQRDRYWVESASPRWAPNKATPHLPTTPKPLYEVQWQPVPTLAASSEPPQSLAGHWLILADQQGVGQALAEQLKSQGATYELIYALRSATQNSIPAAESTLNPAEPETFATELQKRLRTQPCRGIVHLWSLDLTEAATADLESAQHLGSASLLPLVQAITQQRLSLPQLWLVTQGAQAPTPQPIALAQAPLWGLGRVLPLEHPELWGGLIDLDPAAQSPTAQASDLLRLMQTAPAEDYLALRQEQVYTARLEPVALLAATPFQPATDGRYLITGGFGSLGLRVAHQLVAQGVTHLTLLGRGVLPPRSQWSDLAFEDKLARRVQAVQALEAEGAHVEILQADVNDASQMQAAFTHLEQSAQPLKGIVHAAGVVAEHPIVAMSLAQLQQVMRPKLVGTWHLHKLSQQHPIEQFVCFSSIASVWGSFGQAHYAAANAFLDAIAHHRRSLGLPALTINWGPWAEGGMVSDANQELLERIGVEAWQPDDAIALMSMLMTQTNAQMTAAKVDWNRFKPIYEVKGTRSLLTHLGDQTAEAIASADEGPSDFMKRLETTPVNQRKDYLIDYLKSEVASVLKLPTSVSLSIHQGFTELGLDSLMAVDLKGRLEAGFGQTLSATIAFNYPNVETLADYLAHEVLAIESPEATTTAVGVADEAADTVELEVLSEDELADLLDQELATFKV